MTLQTRVRLFIDDDESTPERGLTMEYQPSTSSPLQRLELDSAITLMKVEILDRRTNRWIPFSEAATALPHAVRVSFPPPDDGAPSPALMQLPVVIRIGDVAAPVVGR